MKVNFGQDEEIGIRLDSEDHFYLATSFLSNPEFTSSSYHVFLSMPLETARKLAEQLDLVLKEKAIEGGTK